MENLEAATTFLDKKSPIKSEKFTKGVCEYISLRFYLDVSGCSSFLKKIELHRINMKEYEFSLTLISLTRSKHVECLTGFSYAISSSNKKLSYFYNYFLIPN